MFTVQQPRRTNQYPRPERPRKPLRSPNRPLAFRQEYIASEQTRLLLKPRGNSQSAASFKVLNITDEPDLDDGPLEFTVTGKKYSDRSCREFRDSSGLPLFEIHQKGVFTHSWSITLPGSDAKSSSSGSSSKAGDGTGASPSSTIAKASPRWSFSSGIDDLKIQFENNAPTDAKLGEGKSGQKQTELVIERNGAALPLFDIVDGDGRIADIRESVRHNKVLPVVNYQDLNGYNPVLEITVTSGVDLSLVRYAKK